MYRLHRSGGRVKTAGVGLDPVYPEAASEYARDPSPERAAALRVAFRDLQQNPTLPFLTAFFPQERPAIKQHLQRTGLYRPTLKTDQGPGGTFLPFVTREDAELRTYRIARREGLAVPEAHMAETLAADPAAAEIAARLAALYRDRKFGECAAALKELGEQVGYARRDADVGRGLFFFCNPSQADAPVTIPEAVCARVEETVNELVTRVAGKAARVRALYRDGTPLAEALATAETAEPGEEALYLQADVYVTADGDIQVDQIQLPDLGLFLTQVVTDGHTIVPEVQRIVRELEARATELLASLPSPTYLITRSAVVHEREDTLEQLEIQALLRMTASVGVELRVTTPDDVAGMPAGAQLLLLNVDPASPDCVALLARTARGEIACTPDPFLKLLAPELTTLRRVPVSGEQLDRFLKAIKSGGQMDGKSYHAFHRGIDRMYQYGKHTADILHVEVPGEHTLVPTLRHSVHSFTSLYNTCKRNGFPDLHIREVPMNRDNALIHSDTGPHVSALRFFFSRA